MSIIPREQLLDYPDLYVVDSQPGSFMSGLKSLVNFEAGQPMTYLTGLAKSTGKTWSTVQCGVGPKDNIELQSVLVFVNHSCAPNVVVDLSSPDHSELHFRALKQISPGDDLSFFYPST
ncbi:hypothetical protein BDV93DRAFT_558786 [Ceratobasidium sp. AG-I]|nr:hypothetical protein BDV93DRAFT_558786 [Ceratobasidium sp. AG-I]